MNKSAALTYLTHVANAFDPVEGPVEFEPNTWMRIRNAIYDLSAPLSAAARSDDVVAAFRRCINEIQKAEGDYGIGLAMTRAEQFLDALPTSTHSSVAPIEVWEVWNKTSSVLFATEADANAYIASFPASVGGSLVKSQRPVRGAQSAKEESDAPPAGFIVAGWLRGHQFIGLPEHVQPGDVPVYSRAAAAPRGDRG